MTIARQIAILRADQIRYGKLYEDATQKLKDIAAALRAEEGTFRGRRVGGDNMATARAAKAAKKIAKASYGITRATITAFFNAHPGLTITAKDLAAGVAGLTPHRAGIELSYYARKGMVSRVEMGRYAIPTGAGEANTTAVETPAIAPEPVAV